MPKYIFALLLLLGISCHCASSSFAQHVKLLTKSRNNADCMLLLCIRAMLEVAIHSITVDVYAV
jgi:hypothetical protein